MLNLSLSSYMAKEEKRGKVSCADGGTGSASSLTSHSTLRIQAK